ncbi:MAG: HesB/IscA family protein, partial [Alphaproteobacteria bacterium]
MSLKFSSTGNPIVDYLKISPEAILQLEKLLQKRSEPCDGIRVGVRTRGCSGWSYTMEYAVREKNISKYDDVVI